MFLILLGMVTMLAGYWMIPFGGPSVRVGAGVVLGILFCAGGQVLISPMGWAGGTPFLSSLGVMALAGAWVWRLREPALRWYYFAFEPHPAEAMVRTAISSSDGSVANALQLADALGELPSDDPILREVRLSQAEQLFGELRSAIVAYREERQAHDRAIEANEQAAILGSQEALALASVALEKAKASYAAAQALRQGRA